ncbi:MULTISPECIES: DUF6069 family protein [unclassified Geodermatophilus]|uniref:DUF6069 family protein n=1 Tax=unclassified Geodermatophilus TaxID=2637632 RepID=UPI003EF05FCB
MRPAVDAGRLWAGGLATAVVAALVALVGVLVAEGLLDVSMVEPPLLPIGDSFPVRYALTATALALVATALAHLLVLTTPRPRAFFSWIVGLATVVGVVLPLTEDGSLGGRLATALVDLIIGLCVLSLLSSVLARTASVRRPPPGGRPDPRSYR